MADRRVRMVRDYDVEHLRRPGKMRTLHAGIEYSAMDQVAEKLIRCGAAVEISPAPKAKPKPKAASGRKKSAGD